MFDISWGEMVLVGVVALVVIGPKELPTVMRTVGKYVAKLRTMAGDFRAQFDEAMREAELDEVRKQVSQLGETAKSLNPANMLKDDVMNAVSGLEETLKTTEAKNSETPMETIPDTLAGVGLNREEPGTPTTAAAGSAVVDDKAPVEATQTSAEQAATNVEKSGP